MIIKKYSLTNLLRIMVIIIILIVAIILCLDTFKGNFGNYDKVLIPILDNLYESLYDLKSFIKDLLS